MPWARVSTEYGSGSCNPRQIAVHPGRRDRDNGKYRQLVHTAFEISGEKVRVPAGCPCGKNEKRPTACSAIRFQFGKSFNKNTAAIPRLVSQPRLGGNFAPAR